MKLSQLMVHKLVDGTQIKCWSFRNHIWLGGITPRTEEYCKMLYSKLNAPDRRHIFESTLDLRIAKLWLESACGIEFLKAQHNRLRVESDSSDGIGITYMESASGMWLSQHEPAPLHGVPKLSLLFLSVSRLPHSSHHAFMCQLFRGLKFRLEQSLMNMHPL